MRLTAATKAFNDLVLAKHGVKSVLTQNTKMRKSSQNGTVVYNFGIPAFKSSKSDTVTCPNALHCVRGCYARQGAYSWQNVNAAYEARLALTKDANFIEIMAYQIEALLKKHKDRTIMIRIHDSGDFYNENYFRAWVKLSHRFLEHGVKFYAYTKMVHMVKTVQSAICLWPNNFDIIFSYGGKEDNLIQTETDRHSKVFQTEAALIEANYHNATNDDNEALNPNYTKIGLVYHGVKGYAKTNWDKVS